MRQLYVGTDVIPNDVCPSLFMSISSNKFDANNKLQTFAVVGTLPQKEYAYTLSMTI
jgi:hypothetical protein